MTTMTTSTSTSTSTSELIAQVVAAKAEIKKLRDQIAAIESTTQPAKDQLTKLAIESGEVDAKGRPTLTRYTGTIYITTTTRTSFDIDAATAALGADILDPYITRTESTRFYANGTPRI
jgi:hypothetical protein